MYNYIYDITTILVWFGFYSWIINQQQLRLCWGVTEMGRIRWILMMKWVYLRVGYPFHRSNIIFPIRFQCLGMFHFQTKPNLWLIVLHHGTPWFFGRSQLALAKIYIFLTYSYYHHIPTLFADYSDSIPILFPYCSETVPILFPFASYRFRAYLSASRSRPGPATSAAPLAATWRSGSVPRRPRRAHVPWQRED